MAKAVIPLNAFRQKFGELSDEALSTELQTLVAEFLADSAPMPDRRKEVRA